MTSPAIGRPKKPGKFDAKFPTVGCLKNDLERLERAAEACNITSPQFVRQCVRDACGGVLQGKVKPLNLQDHAPQRPDGPCPAGFADWDEYVTFTENGGDLK